MKMKMEARMNKVIASHVKRYALELSKALRAGKFKRVSPSFAEEVVVTLEEVTRSIRQAVPATPSYPEMPVPECKEKILTGEMRELAADIFEELAVRIIQKKVRFHPSVGQTLHGKY
jgi:hypothetical protein